MNNSRKNVSPQIIRAEEVIPTGWLEAGGVVGLLGATRSDERRKNGGKDEEEDQDSADKQISLPPSDEIRPGAAYLPKVSAFACQIDSSRRRWAAAGDVTRYTTHDTRPPSFTRAALADREMSTLSR